MKQCPERINPGDIYRNDVQKAKKCMSKKRSNPGMIRNPFIPGSQWNAPALVHNTETIFEKFFATLNDGVPAKEIPLRKEFHFECLNQPVFYPVDNKRGTKNFLERRSIFSLSSFYSDGDAVRAVSFAKRSTDENRKETWKVWRVWGER